MIVRPKPQVYRDAAKILMRGPEIFSCVAIMLAFSKHHPKVGLPGRSRYCEQYRKACSRYPADSWSGLPKWWNKPFNLKRRDLRVRALLDMADLCEGKPVPLPLGRRI